MLQHFRSGSAFLAFLVLAACSSDGDEGSEATDGDTSGPTTGMASTTSPGSTSTQTAAGSPVTTSASTTNAATNTTGAGPTSDSGGSGGSGGFMGGPGGFMGGSGGSGGSGGVSSSATEGTTTTSSGGSGGCVPAVECEPEVLPSSGDVHQDCVDRVNQFRVDCWCLPALERWTEGEACADEHAEYDSDPEREPHAGFSEGICENGGNGQNECPGWGSETQIIEGCLQMMYDEGPPPSGQCSGQCFNEHGHFINMTNENYTRVACGFYTTPGGDVWSVQNFR